VEGNRLKRLLLLLALLCGVASAQQDISINLIGPYADFTRGAVWGASGAGNIQNAYIFPPLTPQSLTCVYIANNNPTSAHPFTLQFLYTGDPTLSRYYTAGTTGQGHWKIVSTIADTVLANGINNYSFSSPGAARGAVLITGTSTQTGSPDTADIYIVQTTTSCGQAAINVSAGTPINCNQSATATVATGTTALLVAAPPIGQFIRVCAYAVSGNVGGSAAPVQFANGTAGTCATAGTTLWLLDMTTGGFDYDQGSGIGQLFQTTVVQQPLCFTNTGTTFNSFVSISYIVG
jgi:hypothetical protein